MAFGGLLVVVVGLGRGYTLQNPSCEEPLAGGKVKPVNGHRPSPFFLGVVPIIPAFSLNLLFPWLWGEDLGMGESGSALSLVGEGSLLLPLSGSASASEGWHFPIWLHRPARGAVSPAGQLW